jgi:Flp pilus assembly protein TadG
MHTSIARSAGDFRRDERGVIAVTFALILVVVMFAMGLAVDYGRSIKLKSKMASAIDAAALAGAKALNEQGLGASEVAALVRAFFDSNMEGDGGAAIASFDVAVDTEKSSVKIDVAGLMDTAFLRAVGVPSIEVRNTATAVFKMKDIELGLSLDVTGSMCDPCSKIDALKDATKELLDILMPDGPRANKVRIGFAPFAAGINAGPFANSASDGRSLDGCVYERAAGQPVDDAPPSAAPMTVAGDPGVSPNPLRPCPLASPVVALQDDKAILEAAVDGLATGGTTAGHLGTAWAWYLVSPRWAGVWPAASRPVEYGTENTLKATVLMTDGLYNTVGGRISNGNITRSISAARELCSNMKAERIIIYTVGFQVADADALGVLRDCASSETNFFRAESEGELKGAFRAIAEQLASLRLAK